MIAVFFPPKRPSSIRKYINKAKNNTSIVIEKEMEITLVLGGQGRSKKKKKKKGRGALGAVQTPH